MHDIRLVVEQPAKAVPAEIAHHAHVLGFDIRLDGGADIAGGLARGDGGNAAHHRLVGDFDQALGAARDFAHRIHAARIAVPAIEDQRDVDIDDVAFLQRLLAGNAVADDMVDRGAGGLAIAAIHHRRGNRPMVEREFEHKLVEALGGDAWLYLGNKHVEAFGDQPAGLAHMLESLRAVQLDLTGFAQRRDGGVNVIHQGPSLV